jgi:hypothetical protein
MTGGGATALRPSRHNVCIYPYPNLLLRLLFSTIATRGKPHYLERVKSVKVLGSLALAVIVVAALAGLGAQLFGSSDAGGCTAICVTPEYTCIKEKRVALDVAVRNATATPQQLTITATGEDPANNPRTYQAGETNNFHFSTDGKTTSTINVQSGAGKPVVYTLKPDEPCQDGDGLG